MIEPNGTAVAKSRLITVLMRPLLVEDAALALLRRGRRLLRHRDPAIGEKRILLRHETVGQDSRQFEDRVAGEAVIDLGDDLYAPAVLLDHADGVEVFPDEEMDAVERLRQTAGGEHPREGDRRCAASAEEAEDGALVRCTAKLGETGRDRIVEVICQSAQ